MSQFLSRDNPYFSGQGLPHQHRSSSYEEDIHSGASIPPVVQLEHNSSETTSSDVVLGQSPHEIIDSYHSQSTIQGQPPPSIPVTPWSSRMHDPNYSSFTPSEHEASRLQTSVHNPGTFESRTHMSERQGINQSADNLYSSQPGSVNRSTSTEFQPPQHTFQPTESTQDRMQNFSPLSCPHCSKMYRGIWAHSSLNRHIRGKHPHADSSNPTGSGEKTWNCKVCGKLYHRDGKMHHSQCGQAQY